MKKAAKITPRLTTGEEYVTFVAEKGLKKEFHKKCLNEERTMSGTLRFLMKAYVENEVNQLLLAAK